MEAQAGVPTKFELCHRCCRGFEGVVQWVSQQAREEFLLVKRRLDGHYYEDNHDNERRERRNDLLSSEGDIPGTPIWKNGR